MITNTFYVSFLKNFFNTRRPAVDAAMYRQRFQRWTRVARLEGTHPAHLLSPADDGLKGLR